MNEVLFDDVLRFLLKDKIERTKKFLDEIDMHETVRELSTDILHKHMSMLAILDSGYAKSKARTIEEIENEAL